MRLRLSLRAGQNSLIDVAVVCNRPLKALFVANPLSHITQEMNAADHGLRQRLPGPFDCHDWFCVSNIQALSGVDDQ